MSRFIRLYHSSECCADTYVWSTVFPGNHTSVWGSYFDLNTGIWGFACCHSAIKNSYCAGRAAIEAADAEARGGLGLLTSRTEAREKSMMELKAEADRESKGKRKATDDDIEGAAKKRVDAGKVTEEDMGACFLPSFSYHSLRLTDIISLDCIHRGIPIETRPPGRRSNGIDWG